jgi:hypothetical protein
LLPATVTPAPPVAFGSPDRPADGPLASRVVADVIRKVPERSPQRPQSVPAIQVVIARAVAQDLAHLTVSTRGLRQCRRDEQQRTGQRDNKPP